MLYLKRLVIFGMFFIIAVGLDALKFIFFGPPTLINWASYLHPSWVFITISLLFLGATFNKPKLWKFLFGIHFLVFTASALNHYLEFTSVLNYNCLLFNLIFTLAYFLLSAQNSK